MKATNIFRMLTGVVLAIAATSCSGNMNADLEPVRREKTLDYDVESDAFNKQNYLLSFDAAANSVKVKVTSNTRWAVEVTEGNGWCDVDTYNGLGDGEFTISVKENYSNAVRQGMVLIFMTDATGTNYGEKEINVAQAASSLNISPQSLQKFPAEAPNSTEFTIQSNVPWNLTVSYQATTPFLTVTPLEGEMALSFEDSSGSVYSGSGNVRFKIDLQNNRSALDRRATLTVHGEATVDNKVVEIEQQKTTNVFDVSPAENQLVGMEGNTIEFGVVSIFNWSVTSAAVDAGWISFSVTEGKGEDESVKTVATIAPNQTGFERSTQIWFIPDKDSGVGVDPISVWVSQSGSREAAISVPWLADGFGQTFATVYFNYFSPFEKVTEAGLQWKRETDEGWESRSVAITDDASANAGTGISVSGNAVSGTATIDLTGLDPAMNYVARGFVKEENGKYRYGSATQPFRTAGQYPENGDVPVPSN